MAKDITCVKCKKVFRVWGKKAEVAKHCSMSCKRFITDIECATCKKSFFPGSSTKKYCSLKCYHDTLSERTTLEKNPMWKGDKVGYKTLHTWVKRHKGIPGQCVHCGETIKRRVWANISGKYKRDLNDWMSLCYSCHFKFDHKPTWGQHNNKTPWNKGVTGYSTSLKGRQFTDENIRNMRKATNYKPDCSQRS